MIARTQGEHQMINAVEYPGTRQICEACHEPTERCEEDAIYLEDGSGPLCLNCYHETPEFIRPNVELRGQASSAGEAPSRTEG